MNCRNIVAVMLASTVCIILLASVAASLLYPPGTVTETFRQKIFEIILLIIGIVSGWLLRGGEPPSPPKEPPQPPKAP